MRLGDATWGGSGLLNRLRGLGMAGAVLHLGVHPDDEDTGMMAYLSRARAVRTVYWSVTRGEGGQNRIGAERDEALGIIRTWETLAARQVDGAEALYGPFYDFGFCKSADAALARWGRADLVREIVRAIRYVQPDVVVSRWSGGRDDGHGQHQALGVVAAEAVEAASQGAMFPDLERLGLYPWRPLKLYHSLGADWQPGEEVLFGQIVPQYEVEGLLRINTGALDPVSGLTCEEVACLASNCHRTQAMGLVPEPGDFHHYLRLVTTSVQTEGRERSPFDGFDPSITGLAERARESADPLRDLLAKALGLVEEAVAAFRPDRPAPAGHPVMEATIYLREARDVVAQTEADGPTRSAIDAYLARKLHAFQEVAARCFGLNLECLLDRARVWPGQAVQARSRIFLGELASPEGVRLTIRAPEGWPVRRLEGGAPVPGGRDVVEETYELTVPEPGAFSPPYWLRKPRQPNRYSWPDDVVVGTPFEDPLVSVSCELELDGRPIELSAPGFRRETFVGGFRELPLAVVPQMALDPRKRREIIPVPRRVEQLQLQVTVWSVGEGGGSGTLSLEGPRGWDVSPAGVDVDFAGAGDSKTFSFDVFVPESCDPGSYEVRYRVDSRVGVHREVLRPVRALAPGLPGPVDEANCVAEAFLIGPAQVEVDVVDVAFHGSLRYGYVPGMDEDILESLARFGVDIAVLGERELSFADLQSYDAIVVGPHAYLLRADVRQNAGRLLDYVDRGGTLIVQMQGYGYDSGGFAPYPFRFNQPHDRVSFPDAPITVLDPDHPVLWAPNGIGPQDFGDWVHDRGLYFFGQWDRRYTPILEAADPDEEPRRGGLLVASHGRGTFVYAAYSFFRQIPAGVPGAIRLFANLLGLAEARLAARMELARRVPLFASLGREELARVVRVMSERWIEPGEYLCREGERGTELFVVLGGELEVLKGVGRECRMLRMVGEGEVVGELAVITDLTRSASLRAHGDAKVLSIPGTAFRSMLKEDSDLAAAVLEAMARRLAVMEVTSGSSGSG